MGWALLSIVLHLVATYVNRLEWLIAGSRALFGTILERRVVLALDTSSSDFVNDKVRRFLQVPRPWLSLASLIFNYSSPLFSLMSFPSL